MIGRDPLTRDDLHDSPPVSAPARERLTLVVTIPVAIHRTFSDGVEVRRSGPFWRRQERRLPAGPVHAAALDDVRSLCGLPLDTLHEFGRSRHPFERFDVGRRCPDCHAASGLRDH